MFCKHLRRSALALAVFVSLLSATVALAQSTTKATAPKAKENTAIKPVPRSGGWMNRHESFNARVKEGNVDLLMIGTNNCGSNTPEEIAEGVDAIVKKLRKELPKIKVLVLAIFPRGEDDTHRGRQVNMKANELIAKQADGKTVHFLDINGAFLTDDRILTREVMPDLLHPREKGYGIWAEAMEPAVAKLLGEK